MRKHLPDADALFDYGHGRGWFLKTCRAAGYQHLAGADSSEISVQWLRDHHIAEFSVDKDGSVPAPLFRPEVLTLLDVIEHFEPDNLKLFLDNMLASLAPELKLVVIKAPLTDGILYKTAYSLARLNFVDPLHQLYQVGTHPPHFTYFSRRSMERFLKQAGLVVVDVMGDCEFEPEYFPDRVAPLRNFPAFVGKAVGHGFRLLSKASGVSDTMVFVARTS